MRIEHVAIYVNELESARDFFVRYLGGHANGGYHNPRTGFRSYFITFDDGARIECNGLSAGRNKHALNG